MEKIKKDLDKIVKEAKKDSAVLEKLNLPKHIKSIITEEAGYNPAKIGGYKSEGKCDHQYHN
ncbi:hypothetical protein HOK51_05830 [Candidatus Woesearchaeota archaeon]|jgi:hypothetical protein|nr:hypothetical protein [Candidatus Woesearchaeota archaeon]MBT6519349.1 hypothetical protein [Candidatus Woesearchaeota archaeon]MBT7366809.1 hypothetical protein [Candidatus Woesearchaeota archaeon]